MDENRDREQAEADASEDLELRDEEASGVRGGYKAQKPDGSLDAGVSFKYDIKGQKEG
jgi:hypothetical protein